MVLSRSPSISFQTGQSIPSLQCFISHSLIISSADSAITGVRRDAKTAGRLLYAESVFSTSLVGLADANEVCSIGQSLQPL